jgi:hypothetical protein
MELMMDKVLNGKKIATRLTQVANRHLRLMDTAQGAVERAQASVAGKVKAGVIALISAAKLEGLTGKAITDAVDSLFLRFCVERGALSESSVKSYRTSINMALALNREFEAGLFNDKEAQAAYAAARGVAGKGLAADKRKAHSPGAVTGATIVPADAPAEAPEVSGRKVTLTAPKSADLGLIAPIFADIVGNPARLALFLDWYKATFEAK